MSFEDFKSSGNNPASSSSSNPTKALWRHVFFIERVVVCIAMQVFKNSEEFRKAFDRVKGRGDDEMLENNMKELAGVKA